MTSGMASSAQSPPTRAGERALVVGLAAFAVYHLAIGLLMVLDPATFFERIGPFGELNEHYIRDTATYNFAFAAGFGVAVFRPGWRLPVLVVATLQFVLHTVNHLVDIDEATPESIGVVDFVSLLVATALLAILLVLALGRQGRRRSADAAR
jgi:hypothetical protein